METAVDVSCSIFIIAPRRVVMMLLYLFFTAEAVFVITDTFSDILLSEDVLLLLLLLLEDLLELSEVLFFLEFVSEVSGLLVLFGEGCSFRDLNFEDFPFLIYGLLLS